MVPLRTEKNKKSIERDRWTEEKNTVIWVRVIGWGEGCFIIISLFFIFWWHPEAGGILFPQPGIGPRPPALEVQSLNHWTTREVPKRLLL